MGVRNQVSLDMVSTEGRRLKIPALNSSPASTWAGATPVPPSNSIRASMLLSSTFGRFHTLYVHANYPLNYEFF